MFSFLLQPGAKIDIGSWLDRVQESAKEGYYMDELLGRLSFLTVQAIWHCKTGGLSKKSAGEQFPSR